MAKDKRKVGSESRWIRDLLLVPLIVTVIGVVAAFGLPRFFTKSKELSYTIGGPVAYLADPAIGRVSVKINDVEVRSLTAYQVRLWNSGDIPLKNIAVRAVFTDLSPDFKILNVNHTTIPAAEFGKIKTENISEDTQRFTYELLNPGDEDTIVFLATGPATLKAFAKSEGLRFLNVETSQKSWWAKLANPVFVAFIFALASLMSGFVRDFLSYVRSKKQLAEAEALAEEISKEIDRQHARDRDNA